MNKKSQVGLIITITVLLIFLVIAGNIYFGDEGLFGGLAKGAEHLADKVLSDMPKEDTKKPVTTIDEEAENFFYKILKISNLKTAEICLTQHEEFPEDIGNYELILSKSKENTLVQLFNGKKRIKGETIEDKWPCVITQYDVKDGVKYEILDNAVLKTHKGFWFDGLHIENKGDIKDNNLLVIDKDKFCFVMISNIDEIYNNMKKCSEFSPPIETDENTIKLAKEEFLRFKEFLSLSQTDEIYSEICKEPFSFDINKMPSTFYIVFDQKSKKVSLYVTENKLGKFVDELSLNKEFPFLRLDSKYNFDIYFENYGTFTESFSIAPNGGQATTLAPLGGVYNDEAYYLVNNQGKWAITNLNYWISGNFKKCS